MYVCKTLFTDASLVNKIVGFHKGRKTIKKKSQGRYLQKDRKGKKEEKNKYIACIFTKSWCDPAKYY